MMEKFFIQPCHNRQRFKPFDFGELAFTKSANVPVEDSRLNRPDHDARQRGM